MLSFGILKERKKPLDTRVALVPKDIKTLENKYDTIRFLVEKSETRAFSNSEYAELNIELTDDISSADVLIGVKEVPYDCILPSKTYLFFSHTIKKQKYNQRMFLELANKNCTLIDYECLAINKKRIIGFGRFAGLVGAYNGFIVLGKRSHLFSLKAAYLCKDFMEMKNELNKVALPDGYKIIITGGGRVSMGAKEILDILKIDFCNPEEFLLNKNTCYTILDDTDLYQTTDNPPYNKIHFHNNHSDYHCVFKNYIHDVDMLINGIFWDTDMARLFEIEDLKNIPNHLEIISDISCDINGSVPITLKDTSISDPVFGIDKITFEMTEPYLSTSIDIMAVSNLPTELPRDASEDFSNHISNLVIPEFMKEDSELLHNATILKNGKLTSKYNYLESYLMGD